MPALELEQQGSHPGHPACQSLFTPLQSGGADNGGRSPLRAAGGTAEVMDTEYYT